MTRMIFKYLALSVLLGVVCLGRGDVFAQADQERETPAKRGAWQPPETDRSAYRDIVDFNIFRSDRKRIAEQVERDRNPREPDDPTPTVVVKEDDPPSPDSYWRFTGTTHDADGAVAFIENTKTGELMRIAGPTEISLGEITTIGYDAIVYLVEGEQRLIRVGESLLGERAAAPGGSSTTSSGSGSDGKPPKPGSLEDRLKALRERRARELGNAPAPAPSQPAPESLENPPPTDEPEPDRPVATRPDA